MTNPVTNGSPGCGAVGVSRRVRREWSRCFARADFMARRTAPSGSTGGVPSTGGASFSASVIPVVDRGPSDPAQSGIVLYLDVQPVGRGLDVDLALLR